MEEWDPGHLTPQKGRSPLGASLKTLRRGLDRPELGQTCAGPEEHVFDPQCWCGCCVSSGFLFSPVCLCFSTSKSKELSPGSGQKGSPASSQGPPCVGIQPGAQLGTSPSQPPADQSPHTLRKGMSPPPSPLAACCLKTHFSHLAWIFRNCVMA